MVKSRDMNNTGNPANDKSFSVFVTYESVAVSESASACDVWPRIRRGKAKVVAFSFLSFFLSFPVGILVFQDGDIDYKKTAIVN